MKAYIIIAIIAVIYALIRARHDSYINTGKWKTWAVIEAVFIAGAFAFLLSSWWLQCLFLVGIFGIWFSIFFDMACGWLRAKKLFYFGSDTYDQKMKKIFITPFNFLVFKVIWLIIITGIYEYYIS